MCDLELETKVAEGLRIFHKHLNSVLNVKALVGVGAFNQEKALVGAFSVIVKLMDRFTALVRTEQLPAGGGDAMLEGRCLSPPPPPAPPAPRTSHWTACDM